MTNIEEKELRGFTLKQVTKIIGYAIAVVSCIISLVIRDINRSNEVATLREKILHLAVTANPDDDFIQSLEVSEDILLQIYETVATLPEGLATNINDEMKNELLTQLTAAANFAEMQDEEYPQPPNDAARILLKIQEIRQSYQDILDQKIAKGKAQILS